MPQLAEYCYKRATTSTLVRAPESLLGTLKPQIPSVQDQTVGPVRRLFTEQGSDSALPRSALSR